MLHRLRLSLKVAPSPPWSRGIDSWSRRLRLGLKSRVVFALVWIIGSFPPWSGRSCRLGLGCEELTLGRSVPAMIWKIAPYPPWSKKLNRFSLGPGSRAVSASVRKVAPFPPWTRGIDSRSHHLRLGLESRTVSALIQKVVPCPPWSGKSQRLRLGREELILSRGIFALVWKVSPSPPWSRGIDSWSRRLHVGQESRAVSIYVLKVWKWLSLVSWDTGSRQSASVAKVAQFSVFVQGFHRVPDSQFDLQVLLTYRNSSQLWFFQFGINLKTF